MKKIISLILSVMMLISIVQIYATAVTITIDNSEPTQKFSQSSVQTTDESIKTSESVNKSTALTESANLTATKEKASLSKPSDITSANSAMFTASGTISGLYPVDLGETFYAKISTTLASYDGYELTFENINHGTETNKIPNDNLELVIREPSDNLDHIWKFVRGGEIGAYYYNIINVSNNYYLDNPANASYPEDTEHITNNNVIVYDGNGGDNQKWQIYQAGTNTYYFSPVSDFNGDSNKPWTSPVMDVIMNGASEYKGQVGIYEYKTTEYEDKSNQQFKINVVPTVPKLDDDKTTVTSDAIKFSLFNYNENINRVGGISGNAYRAISPYFSFYDFSGVQKWHSDYFNNRTYYDDDYKANHATVETTLDSNGYPTLRLDNKKDSNGNAIADPLPNPDDRSLAYLFGGDPNNKAVESYSPVNTFLQEMTTTNGVKHYYYNSKAGVSGSVTAANANAVDYDQVTKQFRVRNYTENITGLGDDITSTAEFLPFCTTYYSDEHTIPKASVDYWFGMRMDVDFIQGANGKIGNEEMVFNFTGDDDVWVFIDGVLVLDLGGAHDAVTGSINFATGKVTTKGTWADAPSYETSLINCFGAQNLNQNGTFDDYTSHTLSMFYLERGAGLSTCCIDFNMPTMPDGSLAVAKDVVSSSNENLNNKDNTDYTFRLSRVEGDIQETELQSYTKHKKDGTTETGNGTVTTDENGKYYDFTLKGGESIYFTRLDESVTYKIEEITTSLTYIKSTNSEIIGTAESGDNCANAVVNVSPAATDSKIVKFTNTLREIDVVINFYDRDLSSSSGAPANINTTPTSYTKAFVGQEWASFMENDDPIQQMILNASVYQADKYQNVVDDYIMWTSQAKAVEGMSQLIASDNYKDLLSMSGKYDSQDDCAYRANHKCEPQSGKYWVSYENYSGTTVPQTTYEDSTAKATTAQDIKVVNVWMLNTPKKYSVKIHGLFKDTDQPTETDDKYISQDQLRTGNLYYNQRLGTKDSLNSGNDVSTDHLQNYGLSGYLEGENCIEAKTLPKFTANGNTYVFSYWSFDSSGKTVASTNISYDYRITQNVELYAVYEQTAKADIGDVGVTTTMNRPDVYFDSNGVQKTRLNTMINPYNCQDNDANISAVAAVYVVPGEGASTEPSAIKAAVESALKSANPLANTAGKLPISIGKANYTVYFGRAVLNNKNRAQFVLGFNTSTLKSKTIYAVTAMKYKNEWIASDNYINYTFNENGIFTGVEDNILG